MDDLIGTVTSSALWILFLFADFATFIYLMIVDWPDVNAWNWIVIIPANVFLSTIWPIYWGILHWIF